MVKYNANVTFYISGLMLTIIGKISYLDLRLTFMVIFLYIDSGLIKRNN
jgi:hypothetical protein